MLPIFSLYAETVDEITAAKKALKKAFPKKVLNYHFEPTSAELITSNGKPINFELDLVLDEPGNCASMRVEHTVLQMKQFLMNAGFGESSLTLSSRRPEKKTLMHFVVG